MGTTVGVKMIEMYVDMVEKKYEPIIANLKTRTEGIREVIETQVKKDLGIYQLFIERTGLKLKLEEIEKKLEKFTEDEDWDEKGWGHKNGTSKIDKEVNKRLTKLNEPLVSLIAEKEKAVEQVKLAGISDEIADVFKGLGDRLDKLMTEYSALPPVSINEIKALGNGKKKRKVIKVKQ